MALIDYKIIDSPTILFPNGNETFISGSIVISWLENKDTVDELDYFWYEIFVTDKYREQEEISWRSIAVIPSGNTQYRWDIPDSIKSDTCRIGMRVMTYEGKRSLISHSANDFIISRKKLPMPSVVEPITGGKYFSTLPVLFDNSTSIANCSQKATYNAYYKSNKLGIDWTYLVSNITPSGDVINVELRGFATSDDYEFKFELEDENLKSNPVFVTGVSVNSSNYFLIDTTAPEGSVVIVDELEYTKDKDVTLKFTTHDKGSEVVSYRIEQLDITVEEDHQPQYGNFLPISEIGTWRLQGETTGDDPPIIEEPTDGEKLIYARFKDLAGNIKTDNENNDNFRTYLKASGFSVSTVFIDDDSYVYTAFTNEDETENMIYKNGTELLITDADPNSADFLPLNFDALGTEEVIKVIDVNTLSTINVNLLVPIGAVNFKIISNEVTLKNYENFSGEVDIEFDVNSYTELSISVEGLDVSTVWICDILSTSLYASSHDYYKTRTLFNPSGRVNSILRYYGELYFGVKDINNRGILQKYDGSHIETVFPKIGETGEFIDDSAINTMVVFGELLILGLDNGEVLSYNGSTISSLVDDKLNSNPVKSLGVFNKTLLVSYENIDTVFPINMDTSGG